MTYILLVFLGIIAIMFLFRLLSYVGRCRNNRTPEEVADAIRRHIDGTEGPHDWDDFTSVPLADPRLNAIIVRCVKLDSIVLPDQRNRELEKILADLQN